MAVSFYDVAMPVRGFNGRSVDNETEQHKRHHASKCTARAGYLWVWSSVHVFEHCLSRRNIGTLTSDVNQAG